MANNFTAGVYTDNIFSTQNPTPAQQQQQEAAAQDLISSGMGVVILASMHVHDNGYIYFNDTLMISDGAPSGQLNPNLPMLIQNMGNSGITVLASFGGGGMFHGNAVGYYDFTNIKNLIAQYPNPADNPFFQNLAALFQNYQGISGFDIDLESYTGYDPFQSTLVTLINWLQSNGQVSTIAPYEAEDFWVSVLQETVDGNGGQIVNWVNLQNAAGTLGTFVPALQNGEVGWSDIPGSILAGLQIDSGTSPSDVQGMFYQIGQQVSGLRGGWLWTYENFNGPASGYVNAIQQGLSGTNCP